MKFGPRPARTPHETKDDKELPPAKLVTSDEAETELELLSFLAKAYDASAQVLPARSSTVAQELTIGARPPPRKHHKAMAQVRVPGILSGGVLHFQC